MYEKAIKSLEKNGYKKLVEGVYHKVLDSFEAYIEINFKINRVDIIYFDSDEVEHEWYDIPIFYTNLGIFLLKIEELVHGRCNKNKLK